MRGATSRRSRPCPAARAISIHAPHARSDSSLTFCKWYFAIFQSTLLMRGATFVSASRLSSIAFQSTLLMRGATLCRPSRRSCAPISIHAPHARSDPSIRHKQIHLSHFNPRSSCEERRERWRQKQARRNFNPRSSCEERPLYYDREVTEDVRISIHAPHARSDKMMSLIKSIYLKFQSTLLMRGATSLGGAMTTP